MSEGRKYYTQKEWDAQLERQGGLCATWGCASAGPFHADHFIPNKWEPGKPTQLLCKPCHKAKTKLDVKKIAKVKRIQKKARGETKKKRKITNRGFDKTKTKGFDGKVKDR